MTRFFVYTVAKTAENDKDYEFVEEDALHDFATYEYNPVTMQYSGVAIEAIDFDKAMMVYNHPASDCGEYLLIDEPAETVARRELGTIQVELKTSLEKIKQQLDVARCKLMMKLAVNKLVEANKLMSNVADELYRIYGQPKNTAPDIIYRTIVDSSLQHLIKYNGDSKTSG